MSIEALKSVNYPPFCCKNDWIVDPKKIVSNPAHITMKTISKEKEEEVKEVTKEEQKSIKRRVQFSSYVDVYMRCPMIEDRVRYPSKMIEELKRENSLLSDDLLIAEKRIEQLETTLAHARTINETLPLWMLVVLLVGLVVAYTYIQLGI